MNTQLSFSANFAKIKLLCDIASSGKHKYKRYLGSPLRYAGGKSLAVGFVVELLPDNLQRLVSPFLGGGAIEIAIANEMNVEVLAYDVFDILTNYWNIQITQPEALYKRLADFAPSRPTFAAVKKRLQAHWQGEARLNAGIWRRIIISTPTHPMGRTF